MQFERMSTGWLCRERRWSEAVLFAKINRDPSEQTGNESNTLRGPGKVYFLPPFTLYFPEFMSEPVTYRSKLRESGGTCWISQRA